MDEINEQRAIDRPRDYPVAPPMPYQIAEDEPHLRDYIQVILKRRWTVLTFFLAVVVTVTIGTFMTRPMYEASVIIRIDRENPNVLTFKDIYNIERPQEDYYETQYKILKSRNLAKRVIKSLRLDTNPEFSPQPSIFNISSLLSPSSSTNSTARPKQEDGVSSALIDAFLDRTEVSPIQKSQLVRVSFSTHNPELSAKVANAIAQSYIDFNIESKFAATQQARSWLEKQLDDMKAKVESSEEKLNEYAAKNEIIFFNEKNSPNSNNKQDIVTQRLADLSAALTQATSDRIAKEAIYKEIAKGDPQSSSIVLNNSLILSLKKEYGDAETEYQKLSKIFKPDYPKMVRLKEQINQLKARIDRESKRIVASIKADYDAAVKKESYLRSALDRQKQEALALNQRIVQYQILKREVDTNTELYNGLLQRLKEAGLSATLTASNVQVLDRAEVPKTPYKPKKAMNILLSIVVGLMGGIGLAFFAEYLDNTVKTTDDIERKVNLPALGLVPHYDDLGAGASKELVAYSDNKGAIAEAYRSIGTFILFSSAGRPPKVMLVTSPRQGEGKTTTAVNTAMSIVKSGSKGVLIDADMRKSRLHKIFGLNNSVGLSSFLSGNAEFGDGLIKPTAIQKLDVIPSGPLPPNPSELLGSLRMKELIDALFALYNFVIFDSPPVLGLSDSVILSTLADGVIMVVKAGETPKDAIAQARKTLNGVNARILGVVLNDISHKDLRYGSYSYYHSYYYGEDEKKQKKPERRGRA